MSINTFTNDSVAHTELTDVDTADHHTKPTSTTNTSEQTANRQFISGDHYNNRTKTATVEAAVDHVDYDASGSDSGILPKTFTFTLYYWDGSTQSDQLTVDSTSDSPSGTMSVNGYLKKAEVDAELGDNELYSNLYASHMPIKNHSHSI